MRVSLKNSLIENLLYNERRQKDSIKLFEISDVYTNSNIQKKLLGIIATGRVDKNHEDFTKIINEKYLANIFKDKISGNTIFNYENISRSTLNTKYKSPITFLEVELDSSITVNYESNLIKKDYTKFKYKPISEYPSSNRDLSYSIKKHSKCKDLENFIDNYHNDLLKEVYIFDYFFNEKSNEIKIGFRFIFQSVNTTITEHQVNEIINDIIANTVDGKYVTIPGIE